MWRTSVMLFFACLVSSVISGERVDSVKTIDVMDEDPVQQGGKKTDKRGLVVLRDTDDQTQLYAGKGSSEHPRRISAVETRRFNVTEQENSEESIVFRPMKATNEASHKMISSYIGNIFDSPTGPPWIIPIDSTTCSSIAYGKYPNDFSLRTIFSLEDDVALVYGIGCGDTNCTKNKVSHIYKQEAKNKVTDGDDKLDYVYRTSDDNHLKGDIYKDTFVPTKDSFPDIIFGVASSATQPEKTALPRTVEAYFGLGFPTIDPETGKTVNYKTGNLDTIFKLLPARKKFITIQKDAIVFGNESHPSCPDIRTGYTVIAQDSTDQRNNKWWFKIKSIGVGNENGENKTVKIDINNDFIYIPQKHLDVIERQSNTDNTYFSITNLPIIKLRFEKDILLLRPEVYTTKQSSGVYTTDLKPGPINQGYDVVLGRPFLRKFCITLNHNAPAYQIGFAVPPEPSETGGSVSGDLSITALLTVSFLQWMCL